MWGDNFEGFPLFFVHEVWVSIRRSASLGFIFTRFVGQPKTGKKGYGFCRVFRGRELPEF